MRPLSFRLSCAQALQQQLLFRRQKRGELLHALLMQKKLLARKKKIWQNHFSCFSSSYNISGLLLLLPLQLLPLLLMMLLLVLGAGGASAVADGRPPAAAAAAAAAAVASIYSIPGVLPTQRTSTRGEGLLRTSETRDGPSQDQSLEVLFINQTHMLMVPFLATSTSVSTSLSPSPAMEPPSSPLLSFRPLTSQFQLLHQKATVSPFHYTETTTATSKTIGKVNRRPVTDVTTVIVVAPDKQVFVTSRRYDESYDEIIHGQIGGRRWQRKPRQRDNSLYSIYARVQNKKKIKTKPRPSEARQELLAVFYGVTTTTKTTEDFATSTLTSFAMAASHFANNNNYKKYKININVIENKNNKNQHPPRTSQTGLRPSQPPAKRGLLTTTTLSLQSDNSNQNNRYGTNNINADEDNDDDHHDNIHIENNNNMTYNGNNDVNYDKAASRDLRDDRSRAKRNSGEERKLKVSNMTRITLKHLTRLTSFARQTLSSSHQRLHSLYALRQQQQHRSRPRTSALASGDQDNYGDDYGFNETSQKDDAIESSLGNSSDSEAIDMGNATVDLKQDMDFVAQFRRSSQAFKQHGQLLSGLPRFLKQVQAARAPLRSTIRKRSGWSSNVMNFRVNNQWARQRTFLPDEHREEEVDYLRLHDEKPDGVWRHVAPPNIQTSMAALAPVKVEALSQRSKSVLATRNTLTRHNCSMLLDKGYLPTGAENFAALSVFPFTAICALSAAIFPHMYDVASALVMLYLPFSLVMYYELVATYAGGCQVLWELLADQRMPLKGPPLCCVLPPCCGPGPILTRKRQRLMRYFIYQLLAVPVLLVGVIFVCTLAGIHPGDRLEATNASPYLMLIQALSFVLGTYALVICVKLTARYLPQHALRRKFTVFHLHYTVTRLQVIFFKLTGLTASLPCIPPLSSMASGIYMSCAMLIGQCFLMSTVSQYFFLHAPPVTSLGPLPGLPAHGAHGSSKRSGRHMVAVSGSVNHWLLFQSRKNCQSDPRQSSMPVASEAVEIGANVASARLGAADYADETFSSEPSDAGGAVAPKSVIQSTPSQQLSTLLTSASNNPLNNTNTTDSNNHYLDVPRRVNAHIPLGRALSHPVAGMAVSMTPLSLSIGGLRRVPLSAPEPVNAPSMQCGAPANRANLTLDLKDTHTMTLDRKRLRRPLLSRCSGASSLEDELDLEMSSMATTVRRRHENELLFLTRGEHNHIKGRQPRSRRSRNTTDLCNPLMTCSLDEALRIRELRERRARLWRVSVAGGERWGSLTSQTPPWPVTSLEEVHLPGINGLVGENNAWMDGAFSTVPQHGPRQLPDWKLAESDASPTQRLAAIDLVARRADLRMLRASTRCHAASGSVQYC
ncbi:uncharacterized protein LOC111253000 isoform X2 [Varroa destructor]|uniref:Uncharacterized protein n=1 Tax=Varroa destructor TaxID=109461 RepID=A0A7M7KYD1_VARDE|nr:uncharacterized protein LOC111253000 isoform X2 [Varroa destructor]